MIKKNHITCFLPCRKGSKRILNKNMRPFSGRENGLLEIKLDQLIKCDKIDEIIVSSDDSCVLNYANNLNSNKIKTFLRNDKLSSDLTSTDDLILHALDLINYGHILWTHVTSPFISSNHYNKVIERYFSEIEGDFDSLMSVTELKSFIWNDKPLNYDRSIEKWPRTQTLDPLYEINSGIFLSSANNYKSFKDRIGKTPFLYTLDKITGHDIDWPEDFVIGEVIANKKLNEF
jgi:CMP-N-acetylneuraminic acid synthetase